VALAVWDLIFGSLLHSENQTHKFGLTTKFGEKHNLLHLYVEPFKAAIRIMKRTKISGGP
jgi:hypothetical protein